MLSSSKLRKLPNAGLLLQMHQSAAWRERQMSLSQLQNNTYTTSYPWYQAIKRKNHTECLNKNKRVTKRHIANNTAFSSILYSFVLTHAAHMLHSGIEEKAVASLY